MQANRSTKRKSSRKSRWNVFVCIRVDTHKCYCTPCFFLYGHAFSPSGFTKSVRRPPLHDVSQQL